MKNPPGETGEGETCWICNVTLVAGRGKNGACLDHDHETGEAKKWLCFSCNRGLGCFKESVALVLRAAEYLNTNRAGGG